VHIFKSAELIMDHGRDQVYAGKKAKNVTGVQCLRLELEKVFLVVDAPARIKDADST